MRAMDPREFGDVVEEARRAFAEGDPVFTAGLTLKPGKRATRRQTRRGLEDLIAAIEAVGWQCASVEPFGYAAVEINFLRA